MKKGNLVGLLALASAAAMAPGCKAQDDAPCVTGTAADGSTTLALGSMCLRGVRARVRVAGAWKDEGATIETAAEGRGVRVRVTAPAGAEALAWVARGVPGGAMLQQGYQSWGFSGVTTVPDDVARDADGEAKLAAAVTGQPEDEAVGVSYGSTAIGDADAKVLVIGATSAARATTGIAATHASDGAQVTVIYGATREPLAADADGVTRGEWTHVEAGDAASALSGLRDAIGAALPPGTPAPRRPAGGWFSWNARFDKVDAAFVRAAAEKAAASLLPAGMPLVEIDDGWERAWGDWTATDAFPGGLEAVASDLHARGLSAGVWMAPFFVDVTSAAGKAIDPSLLVRGADGAPLVHTPNGNTRKLYVLDGGNPKAMAMATDAVARLARAGFTFFKLDFLYAGALPGMRASGMSGTEAMRSGLALLRKAAGDGATINGCGAPIVPVLGLVDSLRIGADTAFGQVPLSWPFVAFAARELAARAFLAPLVWPDADQAQLRPPYGDDEARASAAVAALAGPAYGLGDDLTTLAPDRLADALDPKLLDIARGASPALPDALFDAPAADVAINPLFDGYKGRGDTYAPPPASFTAVGASGTRYRVRFAWLAPHGVTIE